MYLQKLLDIAHKMMITTGELPPDCHRDSVAELLNSREVLAVYRLGFCVALRTSVGMSRKDDCEVTNLALLKKIQFQVPKCGLRRSGQHERCVFDHGPESLDPSHD